VGYTSDLPPLKGWVSLALGGSFVGFFLWVAWMA